VSLLRLIQTASFRLAAVYLSIFALSVVALGAIVYVAVGREISLLIDERIKKETAILKSDYLRNGLDHLVSEVRSRTSEPASPDYRLQDSQGQLLAGNLPAPDLSEAASGDGWVQLADPKQANRSTESVEWERALTTRLNDGAVLTVGEELIVIRNAKHAVLIAFAWGLATMLLLGVGGGLTLSGVFLRRIDVMTETAQGIIAGNFNRRVPQTHENDELGRLAATFNQMLDRIGALIEANKHVSSDIAHDLRSPLSRVLRRLEVARARNELSEYDRAVDGSINDIHALLRTFGALLRIGQIESGGRRQGFRKIDLSLVARNVSEAFQPAATDERKLLTVDAPEPLTMFGDRDLLTQLVGNLIDNALRHTPEGSRIEIKTALRGATGALIVADDGPGVPTAHHKLIFQRFYREDAARTSPGDGLGLSIVTAIAELHGCRVAAADNHPGLKITLEVPATARMD
jgi:signal transduction histidine kinase